LGFHGCDISTYNRVIIEKRQLITSTNKYDWLGHGVYFWENNETRALQFAQEAVKRGQYQTPAVIGAVIEQVHDFNMQENRVPFDTVRGIFIEGNEVYPGSGFREKTHIQICVRNLGCIKGYFNLIEKQ